MRLEALAVALPEVAGHPNRVAFEGVLTLIDEASNRLDDIAGVGPALATALVAKNGVSKRSCPELLRHGGSPNL